MLHTLCCAMLYPSHPRSRGWVHVVPRRLRGAPYIGDAPRLNRSEGPFVLVCEGGSANSDVRHLVAKFFFSMAERAAIER